MERLPQTNISPPKKLILSALVMLLLAMTFGVIGSFQYVVPGLYKTFLSFEKIRPLHVTSAIFWILMAATGGTLSYLDELAGKIDQNRLTQGQWIVFLVSVVAILVSYSIGIFGGREYWEFHPVLAIPVMAGWILFTINVVRSTKKLKDRPVYVWMWITGAVGFLITFSESYLWLFPYFQRNIVRDMSVQWKSYGAMVGCWNMLIYGSSIYLMQKISGDKTYARSRVSFLLFFIGLTNLMFNWSHHIYTLPAASFVKHLGYLISMTELFILGRIIYKWKATVTSALRYRHLLPCRFLMAADLWIFINLSLAIFISVPGINLYTHGTHITVAHVMGATIGINSMILLAVITDVMNKACGSLLSYQRQITAGLISANISLLVFVTALTMAGIKRTHWQMSDRTIPFSVMMNESLPYFLVFALSGVALFASFIVIVYPIMKNALACSAVNFLSLKLKIQPAVE
ncbi:MAG: cbb3-type cytochrome c oxidase subunit I [Bacteroidetes bacterium]|nr:cbb3-type cytochrome c oxidase subunit I [Bacteroidota bacterium]